MRYVSANEILFSLLLSIAFGFMSGGLYKSAVCVTNGVKGIFLTTLRVWKTSTIRGFLSENAWQKSERLGTKRNVFDFFFFLILGILYIVLCYLTLDGVFRIYMLIFAAASFFISKITLGALFERVIDFVFKILTGGVFIILFIITLPLKGIFNSLKKLLSPPIEHILLYFKKRKSIRCADKKYREAFVFLKKLS